MNEWQLLSLMAEAARGTLPEDSRLGTDGGPDLELVVDEAAEPAAGKIELAVVEDGGKFTPSDEEIRARAGGHAYNGYGSERDSYSGDTSSFSKDSDSDGDSGEKEDVTIDAELPPTIHGYRPFNEGDTYDVEDHTLKGVESNFRDIFVWECQNCGVRAVDTAEFEEVECE